MKKKPDWLKRFEAKASITPKDVLEEFQRDHLKSAERLIIIWEDEDGMYRELTSGMYLSDAVTMCEVTKMGYLQAIHEGGEEEDGEEQD